MRKLQKFCKVCLILSAVALSNSLADGVALAYDYCIEELGTLGTNWIDGPGRSYAYAINESGQIAGKWPTSGTKGFVITPEHTDADGIPDVWNKDLDSDGNNDLMEDFGKLSSILGVHATSDINDSGNTVGWSDYPGGSAGVSHAFIAEKSGGTWSITDLNTRLPSTRWEYSTAEGINNSNVIVGTGHYDADLDGTGSLEATRAYVTSGSTAGSTVTVINPLGSDTKTTAHAVNNLGQVVGESIDFYGQGYIYTGGAAQSLGNPGVVAGAYGSKPYDINENGQIVGWAKNFPLAADFTKTLAFVLTPEDTNSDGIPDNWFKDADLNGTNDLFQPIYGSGAYGAFDNGVGSVALAINNMGHAVGWAMTEGLTGKRAFVWKGSGYMQDLNDLIDDPKWLLYEACDINELGWITGWGRYEVGRDNSGNPIYRDRAFLLKPYVIPEPSSITLLLCGLVGLMLVYRRLR